MSQARTRPSDMRASPDELVGADRRRGRGARSNRVGRFEAQEREETDDGWDYKRVCVEGPVFPADRVVFDV